MDLKDSGLRSFRAFSSHSHPYVLPRGFNESHMYLLNKRSGFTMIEEGMLIRELVESEGLQQI